MAAVALPSTAAPRYSIPMPLKLFRPFELPATPFHRMRLVATLMLVLMAAVFVSTRWFAPPDQAWVGWVRAFAEAAMVGGLADWFAVTALFRHPLGLPIPHTAIIPANKDRIGDTLASFLKDNFLTASVVARRLEGFDMAMTAARWLTAERVARPGRRRGLGPLLVRLIEALDQRAIGDLIRQATSERLRAMQLSPIVASAIDATLDRRRHEPLVDAAIGWALRTLDDQESLIRGMVTEQTTWLLRVAGIDEKVANSIITGIKKLLRELDADPDHPLRHRIDESLRTFAFDLRHFAETQDKIEHFKDDLIDNPALGGWLEGLWDSARTSIVQALSNPEAMAAGKFGEALRGLGRRLEIDAPLRAAINLHIRRAAVGLVHDYGDEIVRLVSDTIRGWDARTVTDKLESAVGRDLQYIRINGTVIGGLVGLALHAAAAL